MSFSISDAFSRIVLTGTCKNVFDYTANPLGSNVVTAAWSNGSTALKGYSVTGITLTAPIVLSANYYDDYEFLGKNGIPDDATTGYSEMPGYGKRYSGGCKGQLTGNWTARLTSQLTGSTYSVMYYDARYRVIQRKGNNSLNGMEAVYTSYNFEGSPVKEKRIHSVPGQDIITEVRNHTYDLANRLLQTTYQLNDDAPVILVDNVYDEIGRLKTEKRTGHSKLRTDYTYNLRSWTKGINGPLFHQTLTYQESIDGTTPCYNGNISSMIWKSGGSAATNEMGYRFTYDGLSRMKDAIYGETNTLSINQNRFSEQITGYDKMGNILSLLRYGQTSATGYGLVDNLSLVYNGNQLQSVDDHAPNSVYGNGMEFKDNANQPVEYGYDKNGNLTKDLNKNISNIRYNLINLPSQITFSDGNTIDYEYGSDGRKLRTVHQTGNTILTTDYCGNAIYENGSLKLLLTETGYVSFPDKKFHFYLKDHQGNVRVVADKDGKLEETNDYYPFGGTFTTSTSVQPYKYNGKELDRVSGLNLYDYGARYYDATIGRWCMVDSLSEKYYSFNSYNYCGNNPARYVDPDGNGWNEAWPFLKSSLSFSFSIGGQANANVKIMGVNVGLGVNGGSVKIGDGPLTLEKGVSIGVGIFNAENYTRAYELDSWTSVRESGYTVGVPGIIEDHKKTETFDSTGRYFEKTGESNTVDTDYTLGVSASIILGAEISIDLSKMLNFVKELFK